MRRVIYTINAIGSVNSRLRKTLKTRGHFPSDEAATKLIWLALRNIAATWARASPHWKAAVNQFAIVYKERFTQTAYSERCRCQTTLGGRPRRLGRGLFEKKNPTNIQALTNNQSASHTEIQTLPCQSQIRRRNVSVMSIFKFKFDLRVFAHANF